MANPVFPWGNMTKTTLASAATIAASVSGPAILTVALDTAATLNLTIDSETKIGTPLYVRASSDGTGRNLTPGTGMTGTAIAGVANKTKVSTFIYDGSTFVHAGTQQID